MAEKPDRVTLGELLRENTDLFEGYNDRVQWAGRVRNGCAHITDTNYSIFEIKRAIEIFDAAIAEMNGATVEVDEEVEAALREPSNVPYVFSRSFYAKSLLTVSVIGFILFLALR